MALKLFSGTSNPQLSEEVAKHIGVPLAKAEVIRFENSEVRVRIEEDVKHDTCVIIQSTSNPTDTNLMELYLMVDALQREEARRVIGILPYFGYARQDIQHRSGECVSANVIIRFMEASGFHKIYTYNLHDEATEGVFNIPFKNLSAFPMLADEIHKYLEEQKTPIDTKNIAIVSPDQGGIERARKFGNQFFGNDAFQLAVTEKRRDLEHKHQSTALDLYGDVKDKTAIIVDDVTTSGGTLINAAHFCLESGANRVIAAIVHRDFAPAAPKKIQDSKIEAFFTTDTISLRDEYKFEKMRTTSVAKMLAEVIKEIPTVKI